MNLRDKILEAVGQGGPIKGTELVSKIKEEISFEALMKTINGLVCEGKLVEVNYILPSMPYREKSLYFPGGTEIGWTT